MARRRFSDAQLTAFAISQATYVERTIYQVRYPSFDYASIIPVITEGSEWARSTTFMSADIAGKAEWISGRANDIPYADLDRSIFEHPYAMAGIGYQWNLEELNYGLLLGQNLPSDKANAARRISEQFLWNLGVYGDTAKGWKGLVNQTGVTAGDVAANGTGSTTWWAGKTGDQIAADVAAGITGINAGTQETEMADTMLLPTPVFQDIGARRMGDGSDVTIMEFIRRNNPYTAETGQPLLIRALRGLTTADPGGDGRAVIYRRDPEVVRFHLPMPHRFLSVWQNGPMNWMVPGILRSGGVEVRLPKAMRYLDGVYDA